MARGPRVGGGRVRKGHKDNHEGGLPGPNCAGGY